MKSKEPYITCIVSKGRTFRIKPMEDMVENPVWFVPKEELDDYLAEYTKGGIVPCESGLSVQRNEALEYCFKQDKICLMLDDDVDGFIHVLNKKEKEDTSFDFAIKELYTQLMNSPFNLGGFTYVTNLFWYNPMKRISTKSALPAQTLMVKPSKPRFDTNLEVSEDTDFSLQHIVEYGGLIQINYLQGDANETRLDNKKLIYKKTMKGGIEKTVEKQKFASEYLRKKWGNLLKDAKTPFSVAFNRKGTGL